MFGPVTVVCRGHSLGGRLLVVPVKADINAVLLSGDGGVAVWVGGVGGFVIHDSLDALPHASGSELLLKCSSVLSLWLHLVLLMPFFRSTLDEL